MFGKKSCVAYFTNKFVDAIMTAIGFISNPYKHSGVLVFTTSKKLRYRNKDQGTFRHP